MPNLCGVNQKMLSDALLAIKEKDTTKMPSLDPVSHTACPALQLLDIVNQLRIKKLTLLVCLMLGDVLHYYRLCE